MAGKKAAATLVLGSACLVSIASAVDWQRAVYHDPDYPTCWVSGTTVRDLLVYDGYELLDADGLYAWMQMQITNDLPSVVVFSQDIAPDTVLEAMSADCTLRQYLDAGGKIAWYGDIPIYYQGHADGSKTVWGVAGSTAVLGFNAAGGPWDSNTEVSITPQGVDWGLRETWRSLRPAMPGDADPLALDEAGYAAAWVKHYVPGDTDRGFVRIFDRGGTPNIDDIRRAAVYPDPVEPLIGDNERELTDDIVAAFHYPWYGNPATTGHWVHWNSPDFNPPCTWSANYAPDFPDSTWDPNVMLYDSTDTALLRWQDNLMARAGLDIAIASWWGIGTFEDAAVAEAIRICKSVQWCIYYEMEAYANPPASQIVDDIRWVIDRLGPTRNYAKIDGKWLICVYNAYEEDAADRWSAAKQQLAELGYELYINAAGSPSPFNLPEPWDAVHVYDPTHNTTLTESIVAGDDSASISPGFWLVGDSPRLPRDLIVFQDCWADVVAGAERSRFLLVETWNEWHEGTSIEPGQRVDPNDPNCYAPTGDDFSLDFIDALAGDAHALHWTTPGHRPDVPLRLEAEHMVWELGSQPEDADAWRICDDLTRIGDAVEAPLGDDTPIHIAVRVRGVRVGPDADWPTLALYWAGQQQAAWTVDSADYVVLEFEVENDGGVAAVEVELQDDPGGNADVDLVIDYVDVTWPSGLGDVNGDGVINFDDVVHLATCLRGPGVIPEPECHDADLDGDDDVDLADLALFQAIFPGGN